MTQAINTGRQGAVLAAGAALGYASTLIFQGVLADDHVHSSTVLTFRFGVSALLLLALGAARRAPLRPVKGDRIPLFLLGALCFMAAAASYFAAIGHGTTAAVIVLVYLYPVLVTVVEAIRARRRPSTRTSGILMCSIAGCALVAVGGGTVSIEPIGVVFAVATACLYTVYITVGAHVGTRSDATASAAWVALGAAAAFIAIALAGPGYGDVAGHVPQLLGVGTSNAIAFGLTFAAFERIGPSQASVVLTLEAVFTVILSTIVLHETLAALQIVGAVGVLVAAATIFSSEERVEVVEREAAVP